MSRFIDLSSVHPFPEPFPHAFFPAAVGPDSAVEILSWFENGAPWKLTTTEFYEQYEFSVQEVVVPRPLEFLKAQDTLGYICGEMDRLFRTTVDADHVDITVHKLIPGQRIRIHNDYIHGQETHRLLIQLNRGWCEEYGGMLLLFKGPSAADLMSVVRPFSRTAFAFAISPYSQHAVAPVLGGERFTLVYSFYGGA
jgi:Rps23 Pro-64 3,4-dihydroxylase Tpa1-like proline 4-hydroxylase